MELPHHGQPHLRDPSVTTTDEHVAAICREFALQALVVMEVGYQEHFLVLADYSDDNGGGDNGESTLHMFRVRNYAYEGTNGPITTFYDHLGDVPPGFATQLETAMTMITAHIRFSAN